MTCFNSGALSLHSVRAIQRGTPTLDKPLAKPLVKPLATLLTTTLALTLSVGMGLGAPAAQAQSQTSTMTHPAANQTCGMQDKVAARAYEKWLKRGCKHGNDQQDWAEAEAEIKAEQARTGAAPKK